MHRKFFITNHQSGFTLIEMLICLFISCLMVFNFASMIRVMTVKDKMTSLQSQIEEGVASLSQYLISGKNYIYGQQLTFINEQDEECTLSLNDHRLVLTPGLNIFLRDIDDVSFEEKNHLIYIHIQEDDHHYSYMIGSDYQDENLQDDEQ